MGKRQQFEEGAFVKINISEGRLCFGRLFTRYNILVYNYVLFKEEAVPSIETIEKHPALFYVGLNKGVVTQGQFEIIGFKKLSEDDMDKIPPTFLQDFFHYRQCTITHHGITRDATPDECVGLEMSAAWDADNIIERIEDHYAGVKNFNVELNKPILSYNDIRYCPPPQCLKWDDKKREFYRTDLKE
jgi:hypothetical protein